MKKFQLHIKLCCAFLCAVFLFSNVSEAQTGNEIFRHISSRDGLSSGFVWEMMEDENGYLWIASNVGVDKYDGYSVTSYRNDPSDSSTIAGGPVFNIFDDSNGKFWIAAGSGISIMDPATGTFKQVLVSGEMEPIRLARDIRQTENGDIWVASQNGIYRFPDQNFSADTLETELFQEVSGDTIDAVNALEIQGNTLWVGTDSNLHTFNLDSNEFTEFSVSGTDLNEVIKGTIWDLLLDSNGTLWISSNAGLARLPEGSDVPEVIKSMGPYEEEEFTNGFFQALSEDHESNLWITTGFIGAIKYNLETGEVKTYRHDPSNQNSIREDDVHYVLVDRSGNTWFGYHDLGLSLMYSQAWTYSYNQVPGEYEEDHPLNYIHSYLEDDAGNGWLATHWGLGYIPADGSSFRYFPLYPDNLSGQNTGNELEATYLSGNQIFVLTHSDEIHVFDIEDKTFEQVEIPDDIPDIFMISTTTTSNDNHFYLPSVGSNLLRINQATLETSVLEVPQREADENIQQRAIFPFTDQAGDTFVRLYYAYASGLEWDTFRLNTETDSFTELNIQSPDGIAVFGMPRVSSNQPGIVWSISNNGLLREDLINEETQLLFQSDVGVLNESNRLLVEDEDGYLWISNRTGITQLDPVTESITYFEADPNRKPTNYMEPSLAQNGDIIFAGEGGYTRFNPNELISESPIQNIHITELWGGSDVQNILNDDEQVYELDHDDNNISISYIGLNYRDPNYTRYRYRLNGYDNDWNNVGAQRRVFLANLPPGNYTFQVQAAQRFGGFSENTAELSLFVLPPWWQTIPAYIGFFLIFIGGVIVVNRVQRKRVIRKERERSREKELEQAKEIEKAYENLKAAQEQLVQQEKLASLGQLTAGIAHEIKNPLNFVNNFSDLSVELIQEVREEVKMLIKSPFEGGKVGEANQGDDPASDSETKSGSSNTPLSPLSRGEAGASPDGTLILDILDDIEANLRKIHEHGSRADSIVKSMLQHSRGGNNKMEPTDINALIQEYSNLAFHGMRAGKNPINVDIELNLDKNINEIPLIAEDFSRVVLNLCNNAFDAMREKLLAVSYQQSGDSPLEGGKNDKVVQGDGSPDKYEPKLTIRTHQKAQSVTIEIEDNGPGIPDEIKDKILQPFFTTKKGTEGTGLGLSITNDIIKAHGGRMDVESKGEGTIMRIILNQT